MEIIDSQNITIKSIQPETKLVTGYDLMSKFCDLNVLPSDTCGFIVIVDKNISRNYGNILIKSLKKLNKPLVTFEIRATEENKSFGQIENILSHLLKYGVNRKYIIINLGGGIVSDLGGFAASILFRGIPYINIPTTLLSQVDAAIGGKTGVNFQIRDLLFKNMAGTISMPLAVISDINVLETLTEKEIKNGLGEMLKYSLIFQKINIRDLISLKDGKLDKKQLSRLVSDCQRVKMDIVCKDPFDTKGQREKLNLGHTIGHGIESASNGKLSHGQSVATGIAACVKISIANSLLSENKGRVIISNIQRLGLPININGLNYMQILDSMKMDKKNGTFVLIRNDGEILIKQKVDKSLVIKTLKEMCV